MVPTRRRAVVWLRVLALEAATAATKAVVITPVGRLV